MDRIKEGINSDFIQEKDKSDRVRESTVSAS